MSASLGWIKVGERYVNLVLTTEIDDDFGEDGANGRTAAVFTADGNSIVFKGDSATALRSWLTVGMPAGGASAYVKGPLSAFDVLAWWEATKPAPSTGK